MRPSVTCQLRGLYWLFPLLDSCPLSPPPFPKVTSKINICTLVIVLGSILGEQRLRLTQNPEVSLTLKLCEQLKF